MLGIALGREHLGHDYGTDAMHIVVDYGFCEVGLHGIQLGVFVQPCRNPRLWEGGFVEEGRHRESVLHDGRW
jgi:RimJ/RimL family protein N-acetyltransferase